MIHLDRNLHSSKQNIDHHKILSWSSLSHDDHSFNPDDFLSDALTAVDSDIEPVSITASANSTSFKPGPATPVNANGPALSHTSSPASPADGNSTSPTRDRSSSLSPAPETGSHVDSPPLPAAAEEKEAPAVVPQREEEEEDDEVQVNHASRQSTPLSELSPPPDQDDEPDVPEHGKSEEAKATGSENVIEESGGQKEPKADVMRGKTSDHDTSLASSPRASTDAVTSESKPGHDLNLGKSSSSTNYMASSSSTPRLESPSRATPSIESPATPSATLFPTSPTQKSDPKVISILELNSELLKICIDFQSRGFSGNDMKFQQFSSRLQSNLTWLAAAADHSRSHLNMILPIMEPPPPIDFTSTERIQQLYTELPSIFAKEIARRNQINAIQPVVSSPNTPLKRERSDESPVDIAMKRRNTGDSKNPAAMMPPPSSIPSISHNSTTHFSLPISNGPSIGPVPVPPPPSSPQLSEAQMASINPSVINTAEAQLAASNRERVRQAQIRAAHQQQASRQMSPPSIPAQQQIHGIVPTINPSMNVNATAGPSNSSNIPSVNGVPDTTMRQIYNVLRTPDHPFMQYMRRNIPNFQALPTEIQVQRMVMAQNALQRQQQDQQQQNQQNQMASQPQRPGTAGGSLSSNMNTMSGMPMQNNPGMPVAQFPGPISSPVSPIPPQSPMMHQAQQNPMFTLSGNPGQASASNTGIDPRMMMSGGGNMNMNNLSQHQRQQLMLMQQQSSSRFGGNSAPPNPSMMNMNPMSPMNLNMNPQQTAAFAAQHQQRMAHAGSPPHSSPGTDGQGFPILRSNSTIPGIARSTRSPSEGAPSPMTPRGPPTRGSSLGQEDYQRMLMQQQQAQAARGMSSAPSPVYNQQQQQQQHQQQQQQQQQHVQWSQNQNQNQGQAMQMMGQQGSYGMSPPGSASGHYGGGNGGGGGGSSAPSPSNSQNQNWLQGQANYPFAPSPGASGGTHHSDHMQAGQIRHMSATPGPQQMSSQNMNSPPVPSPAEQPMPHDFDLFNWA